jgi:hypothetical protein
VDDTPNLPLFNPITKEITSSAVPLGSNPPGGLVYAFGTDPSLYCKGAPSKISLEKTFEETVKATLSPTDKFFGERFEQAWEKLLSASTSPDNPFAHGPAFTLPVISLVLITILNDGCMITISQDFVVPEKKPQTWRIFEASVIACVIGLIATVSSLFLVVGCLHTNILGAGEGVKFVASAGRTYLTWFEVRSIIYLKVSISDFLTLFSARTRGWFWERRLANLLGGAACAALFASTLFALYWDNMCFKTEAEKISWPKNQTPKLGPSAYMSGLRNSEGAVFCVWIYCILWWFVQDVCKVGAYWVLEKWEDRGFKWSDLPGVFFESAPKGSKWEIDSGAQVVANPVAAANKLPSKEVYANPVAMKR